MRNRYEENVLARRLEIIKKVHKAKQKKESLERDKLEKQLVELLSENEYLAADALFFKNRLLAKKEYEELKAFYLRKTISRKVRDRINEEFDLTPEQAEAIARIEANLLLVARAGAGKTTTIACKTLFLVEHGKISPDEIMILAFNKDAAREIRTRINNKYKIEEFHNGRTFHSLAFQLVSKIETIRESGVLVDYEQQGYVQNIIRSLMESEPDQRKQLYRYFRREVEELRQIDTPLSAADYDLYRSNLRQITLRGEQVKSIGEKYIADFLFEHGISYDYEKPFFWEGIYRPDFYLRDHQIVIEHWGIDESDPRSIPPISWTRTRQEYIRQIREKREYWKNREKEVLIETSIKDTGNRELFEQLLKAKLKEERVICQKLPEEELLKKIERRHIARITELCLQLIQKAKKRELTVSHIRRQITQGLFNERVGTFLRFAARIYESYELKLRQEQRIDFDDLLLKASELIRRRKGECALVINKRRVELKNLKWILIDEYQDFSRLFFELISSIKEFNTGLRLLAHVSLSCAVSIN